MPTFSVIISHPAYISTNLVLGDSITLETVTSNNSGPVTYKWAFSNTSSGPFVDTSTTTSTFTITNAQASNAGFYQVTAHDGTNTATAMISVTVNALNQILDYIQSKQNISTFLHKVTFISVFAGFIFNIIMLFRVLYTIKSTGSFLLQEEQANVVAIKNTLKLEK